MEDENDSLQISFFKWALLPALFVAVVGGVSGYFFLQKRDFEKLLNSANLNSAAGKEEQALKKFEDAYLLDPTHEEVIKGIAKIIAEEDPQRAFELLNPIIIPSELSFEEQLTWATILVGLEKYEESNDVIQSLIERDPENEKVKRLAGRYYVATGDYRRAGSLLIQTLRSSVADEELRYLAAVALTQHPNFLDRVFAKNHLMRIAKKPESPFSVQAMEALLDGKQIPLFVDDLQEVFETYEAQELNLVEIFKTLSPENVRVSAELMAAINPKSAYELFGYLVESGNASYNDKLFRINIGQKVGEHETVSALLDSLLAEKPENINLKMLKAREVLLSGNAEKAIVEFSELVDREPENRDLFIALYSIARSPDYPLSKSQRAETLEKLSEHATANSGEKLWALRTLVDLQDSIMRKKTVDKALELLGEVSKEEMVRWLNDVGEFEEVLNRVTVEDAKASPQFLVSRLEALLKLKRYEEVDSLLTSVEDTLSPLQLSVLKCRRYAHSGDYEKAQTYWKSTYKQAGAEGAYETFLTLARMVHVFEGTKADKLPLVEAFRQARSGGVALNLGDWQLFMILLLQEGLAAEGLSVAQVIADRFPEEPDNINNYIYLAQLLQKSDEAMTQRMERLVESHPLKNEYKVTLALGYFREGKPSDALDMLEKANVDVNDTERANVQAIYAAILAADGQTNLATSFAKTIELERLLNPEYQLIKMLFEE